MQDERIVIEQNKVYRILFYLFCGGIFLDLTVKWNFYRFDLSAWELFRAFGWETLCLIAVFGAHIFLLAARGIYVCAPMAENTVFPRKKTAMVAFYISLALTIGLWGLRFTTSFWEYGIFAGILFVIAVCALTAGMTFGVLFGTFYAAWRVAAKYEAEEE